MACGKLGACILWDLRSACKGPDLYVRVAATASSRPIERWRLLPGIGIVPLQLAMGQRQRVAAHVNEGGARDVHLRARPRSGHHQLAVDRF